MRKNIFLILSYFTIIIKISCTLFLPISFVMLNSGAMLRPTAYFSATSLFVTLLVGDLNENTVLVIIFFAVVLLWLTIIVLAILGTKIKRVRIPLCILVIISAISDSVITLIFSDTELKFAVTLTSLAIISICLKSIYDLSKHSKPGLERSINEIQA